MDRRLGRGTARGSFETVVSERTSGCRTTEDCRSVAARDRSGIREFADLIGAHRGVESPTMGLADARMVEEIMMGGDTRRAIENVENIL